MVQGVTTGYQIMVAQISLMHKENNGYAVWSDLKEMDYSKLFYTDIQWRVKIIWII